MKEGGKNETKKVKMTVSQFLNSKAEKAKQIIKDCGKDLIETTHLRRLRLEGMQYKKQQFN